jgi:uncharacterized membrane protein YhaH (DUF805 family)
MNASMDLKAGPSLRLLSWRGRSSRTEFWLIFGLYMLICMLAPTLMFVTFSCEHEKLQRLLIIFLPQLSMLYLLLAAGSRRLQDAGMNNGIQALPIGLFVALVFFAWSRDTHNANMLAFLPYCGFALLSLTWWYCKRSIEGED